MPEARVLRLFRGTCEGLKALHTHEPTALAHRLQTDYTSI